ncbi:histidine phosphatase family protein [Brevibacillus sp. B_LB10_24]|uniref:histidine phosphatase family protein n=1 Tax=Brevibacillus sp. B_LB10_24 TaxID=3380645 RepID=UPI0038B8048A
MVTLVWARHGAAAENRQKRYIGHLDVPLCEEGREQAARLADRLAECRLRAVYTSDLRRTEETAAIIAACHPRVSVSKTPLLRELSFGEWEGLTYDEIVRQDPDLLTRFYDDPWTNPPNGGESLVQMQHRLDAFMHHLLARHQRGTVLIVSHGGVIRLFYALYLMQDRSKLFALSISHGEYLRCTAEQTMDGWRYTW